MSKKELQALHRTIEDYQLTHYLELNYSYAKNREQSRQQKQTLTQNHKQTQMERRGVGLQDKKELASTVEALLSSTDDVAEFKKVQKEYDIETYRYKGRLMGVKYNNRKYRFSRLLKKDSVQMKMISQWNGVEKWQGKGKNRDRLLN